MAKTTAVCKEMGGVTGCYGMSREPCGWVGGWMGIDLIFSLTSWMVKSRNRFFLYTKEVLEGARVYFFE